MQNSISKAVLSRLPTYLSYLKSLNGDGSSNISATIIASALSMGEVQVRKDLASISKSGKPKVGYVITDLINELETFLGYKVLNDAVIIGAGRLGKALLEYEGFKNYGLNIIAAFDSNDTLIEKSDVKKPILPIKKFEELCKRMNFQIGIITVPAANAQEVCDLMVKNGISAIWNFAPVHLEVPDDILVRNEDMAVSLALLSGHLAEKFKTKK